MQTCLHRILVGLNSSITRMSKNNIYYPPKLNLDKSQSIESLLIELDKVELFLRAPEYSYLFKDKYKSLSK